MSRQVKPHGTRAAYQRHLRAGEPPCQACREACAEYTRDYRAGNIGARERPPCGTLRGYNAHRYRSEQACRACLDAHAVYINARRARIRAERAQRAAALEAAWAEVLAEAGVL